MCIKFSLFYLTIVILTHESTIAIYLLQNAQIKVCLYQDWVTKLVHPFSEENSISSERKVRGKSHRIHYYLVYHTSRRRFVQRVLAPTKVAEEDCCCQKLTLGTNLYLPFFSSTQTVIRFCDQLLKLAFYKGSSSSSSSTYYKYDAWKRGEKELPPPPFSEWPF